jgi:hypothetical protein
MAAGKMPNKPANTEGAKMDETKDRFMGRDDFAANKAHAEAAETEETEETDASDSSTQPFMPEEPEDTSYTRISPSEDMTLWQDAAAWPQPTWLTQSQRQKKKEKSGYRTYYFNSLRSRYLELEADFRTCYNNFYHSKYMDLNTAQIVIGYLQSAKKALEGTDGDIYDIVTMLNLAEQGMIGLYPPHVAKARVAGLGAELKAQKSPWGDYLLGELNRRNQTLGGLRAALDKTKSAMNEASQSQLIATSLQIERLRTAWMWSLIVLGFALCFLPMMVNYDKTFWTETAIAKTDSEYWRPWYVACCMALFGIGGAFFSSLMQVRSSTSNLKDFQEKQKDSQLKLAVGGIAALIMFIFLSWQIIPGVELKNAGSFLFLAFVAGFSERYFLRILNIEDEAATPLPDKPAPIVTESPSLDAQATDTSDAANADVNTEPVN